MKAELELTVRFAWWLEPYLYALAMCCALMRREPDWGLIARVIERAVLLGGR